MQARELTPTEVAEGERNISDTQLSATQVQALVRKMDASKHKHRNLKRAGKKDEYEAALRKEDEFLYYNYPSLFQMHMEDRLDSTFFEMLALKRKIERGEITAEQASTVIGQQLFNRYVPQAIGQTPSEPVAPRMSYADYYKQNQE
jgi:hypothetical protein